LCGAQGLLYSPAVPLSSTPDSGWGRERRKSQRFPLTVPVKVLYGKAPTEAQFGFTADVSSNGALLLLPAEIHPGTEVEMRVSLPQDLQNIRSQFVDLLVNGTVTRIVTQNDRTAIGVHIHTLTRIAHA
jgi:hypothetical protein